MRQTIIFGGSSHPQLVTSICTKLAMSPGSVELKKFSNGETSVQLQTSIRNQDVFIIQSGSPKMNDSIMELLIMISACKGGSARSITAVMPYFPYSRQSKKKSHRGTITAKMVADLLKVAGVTHVITIDLHSSQMQGFFRCPVDNLVAEPLMSHWIRHHYPNWKNAVIVSKNPGGTKRVTSLADALKLSFGIVTTDRRREAAPSSAGSIVGSKKVVSQAEDFPEKDDDKDAVLVEKQEASEAASVELKQVQSLEIPSGTSTGPLSPGYEAFDDQQAPDVTRGVLVGGHIVENSNSSDPNTTDTTSTPPPTEIEPYPASLLSPRTTIQEQGFGGGSVDGDATDEDEEDQLQNPNLESTVTLVGDVRGRPVFIVDDMIDKPGTWIAAAETCVKRAGALEAICIASHGIFSRECLEELENCECISKIVVTNSYPIPPELAGLSRKVIQLDVSRLLAEAIRRTKHGESMSQLFLHYD